MTQETSEKVVTVGGLQTFYQRLVDLFCSEDTVNTKLVEYDGNASNQFNANTLTLNGANSATATLSVATVTPVHADAYNVLRITCGHNITEIPVGNDKTIATIDDVINKANKISVEYNSSSYDFLSTPVLMTFYGMYTIKQGSSSGTGDPEDVVDTPTLNAGASLVGKIMYIYGDGGRLNITGYTSPGFYFVTGYSTGVITAATYICSGNSTGLYFNITAGKLYRLSDRDSTLVALNLGGTVIEGSDVTYDIADENDIEAIFEELGLNG